MMEKKISLVFFKMQETSWDKARCRKMRRMPKGERLTFEKHKFGIFINLNCEIINYVQVS